MKDIDFATTQKFTAVYSLTTAFNKDPMMQLFDNDARQRLASFIIVKLYEEKPANLFVAGNLVTYRIMPNSIYSAFGQPLASQVGYLVQESLWPVSYKEVREGKV
jgi:hypothetical protein